MPLGMDVGLSPGDFVFDKDPTTTQFLAYVYCGQTAGWMKTSLGTEVDLGTGHIVLDVAQLCGKGAQQTFIFSAYVYCGHGRPSQLLLSSYTNGRPKARKAGSSVTAQRRTTHGAVR